MPTPGQPRDAHESDEEEEDEDLEAVLEALTEDLTATQDELTNLRAYVTSLDRGFALFAKNMGDAFVLAALASQDPTAAAQLRQLGGKLSDLGAQKLARLAQLAESAEE